MHRKKYDEKTRQVRKLSKVVITDLLKQEGPCMLSKITFRIKKELPDCCDNEIMCTCRERSSKPEWLHQVQWALADLKSKHEILYDRKTKLYSISNKQIR